MPNGGGDNCWTCGFNRNNDGKWGHSKDLPMVGGYCTIRRLEIFDLVGSFCKNWHTKNPVPEGQVYSEGLWEHGYTRIPWHGDQELKVGSFQGRCLFCESGFQEGIQVGRGEGFHPEFCCNLHYLTWWKQQHPGEELVWEGKFEEPGEEPGWNL